MNSVSGVIGVAGHLSKATGGMATYSVKDMEVRKVEILSDLDCDFWGGFC